MANRSHTYIVADQDCLERFGSAIRHLCVGLIDEAMRTTIVGPPSVGLETLSIGPIRVHTHRPLSWFRRHRALAELVARLSEDPPDLVHAMSGGIAWLGAHLAAALDVPLVVSVTGRDELSEDNEPILKSAATIITVSEPLRAAAIQQLQRSPEDVRRIRWGLAAQQRPSCFMNLENSPTLVTISPLVADAGLGQLIDATALLVARSVPVMLFISGTGPAETALRQRVHRLKLDQVATFVGPIREWPTILLGADVFVLPATQRRLTIHPLAAMAAGVTVVAAEGGDNDYLVDGQTARVYDPPSAELLAAVLAEVLGNPEASRQLAAAAQLYVGKNHRVSTMVTETLQVYRELTLTQETIPMPSPKTMDTTGQAPSPTD